MNLFLISLLLVLTKACLGLKCYICHGGHADHVGRCDEGQEIEKADCPDQDHPNDWHCQLRSQYHKRTHIGCSNNKDIVLKNNEPECKLQPGRRETCYCDTDLCNIYTEESFKCLQCMEGKGMDECGPDEIPQEYVCKMDEKYCYYRWTNFSVERSYRGCATKLLFSENMYTHIGNISICHDNTEPGYYTEQQCFCTDPLCNNYLNRRKRIHSSAKDTAGEIKFTALSVLGISLLSTIYSHFNVQY